MFLTSYLPENGTVFHSFASSVTRERWSKRINFVTDMNCNSTLKLLQVHT